MANRKVSFIPNDLPGHIIVLVCGQVIFCRYPKVTPSIEENVLMSANKADNRLLHSSPYAHLQENHIFWFPLLSVHLQGYRNRAYYLFALLAQHCLPEVMSRDILPLILFYNACLQECLGKCFSGGKAALRHIRRFLVCSNL